MIKESLSPDPWDEPLEEPSTKHSAYDDYEHQTEAVQSIMYGVLEGQLPVDTRDRHSFRVAMSHLVGTVEMKDEDVLARYRHLNEIPQVSGIHITLAEYVWMVGPRFRNKQAACSPSTDVVSAVEQTTEMMFPSDAKGVWKAKMLCFGCPVIKECIEYGEGKSVEFGVWGGYSARQRKRLRSVRKEAVKTDDPSIVHVAIIREREGDLKTLERRGDIKEAAVVQKLIDEQTKELAKIARQKAREAKKAKLKVDPLVG